MIRLWVRARWVACGLLGAAGLAGAAPPAPMDDSVRAEVMRPLQAAQEATRAGQGAQALALVREAESVPQPTAQEHYLTLRMRAVAAALAGEPAGAVAAFEAALGSGRVPGAERPGLWLAMLQSAQAARDAQAVVRAARGYLGEGGQEPRVSLALAQALAVLKDPLGMVQVLAALLAADEAAGRPSTEAALKLLAAGHLQLGQELGYESTLERLLRLRSDPAYWAELIARRRAQAGFPASLQLDALRLARQVSALRDREAYLEYVQLAMQAGQPAEAHAVFNEGLAQGVFGPEPLGEAEARQQQALRKAEAEDRDQLAGSEASARRAGDGGALCALGQAAFAMGQTARGLAWMEEGLAQGVRRQPDEHRLRWAVALWQAGRPSQAQAQWRLLQAQASPAVRQLASMWRLMSETRR